MSEVKRLLGLIKQGKDFSGHGDAEKIGVSEEEEVTGFALHDLYSAEIIEGGNGQLTAQIPDKMLPDINQNVEDDDILMEGKTGDYLYVEKADALKGLRQRKK